MPALAVQWVEPNRFPVGWSLTSHRHDRTHELVLVVSGRLRTTVDGVTRIAEPGDAVLHVSGRAHAESTVGGRPLETLYASWWVGTGADPSAWEWQRPDASGRIAAAMRWASEAFAEGTPAGVDAASGLITAALHELAQSIGGADAELVRRVRAYVLPRLAQALTLDELARAASLSRRHFVRRFTIAAGSSPMRWLRALRLDAGRHLLATTDRTVEAVGQEVGFPDRFHFSRAMSQRSGRPPSAWRTS
ncbi:MAG: AraC family transcriptional regulator [Planctomycetes bacterium]|nr:AraC family transcriptional regulator [Planctomycetota bacterium]